MPCLLGCIALAFPRVVLIVVWLTTKYLDKAFHTLLWPVLGFFFMPYTTLAYAFAMNSNGGTVNGAYLAVVVAAAMVDLGVWGGASRRNRYRTTR